MAMVRSEACPAGPLAGDGVARAVHRFPEIASQLARWGLVPAFALAWWLLTPMWPAPAGHAALLLAAAVAAWALELLPDFVVALTFVAIYNVAGLGPSSVSLSGFASPAWFLLVGILAVGAALNRSGLLQRLALRLLRLFPPTFRGQSLALLLGGLLATPLLPLTVGRCALTAPLAVRLAEALRYPPRSRQAVGIGLSAFVGAGLLSRGFLSGATLNLIAWSLLPPDARVGWGLWAVAAAPTTLLVVAGSLAMIHAAFRPAADQPLPSATIEDRLRALGPASRGEWLAGGVTLAVLLGFVLGPRYGVESAWIACAGALVLVGAGVLTREHFRSAIDWPLLLFLGVVLSLPAIFRHAGLEARLKDALPLVLGWAQASPARGVAVLFLVTVGARFVLSEWVGVPLLTMALLPAAHGLSLHPWVVAYVVLVGANLWVLPYQFASYLAFWGGTDGRLFGHRQVRLFAAAYMAFSLVGLLASIPFWRLLGLVG